MADPIPEPIRIEVSDGARLEIQWADGASTVMSAAELRAYCHCAACRELPPTERTPDVYTAATIESAELVGSYAINFTFGPDGHGAGIYPYADLRRYRPASS